MTSDTAHMDVVKAALRGKECTDQEIRDFLGGEENASEYASPDMEVFLGMNRVIERLREKQFTDKEAQFYLTGEVEELNCLSPTEMLMGRVFPCQAPPSQGQARLLNLPFEARLKKVLDVIAQPFPWEAIG